MDNGAAPRVTVHKNVVHLCELSLIDTSLIDSVATDLQAELPDIIILTVLFTYGLVDNFSLTGLA